MQTERLKRGHSHKPFGPRRKAYTIPRWNGDQHWVDLVWIINGETIHQGLG